MRSNDVKALLEYVCNSLDNLKKAYDQSLELKETSPSLRIQVKNVMENLRSALDYMAQDVHENIILPNLKNQARASKDIYFPYGKDKQTYELNVKKCFPSLEVISHGIYSLFEKIQPHACGDSWLYDFCKILNENKHDSLSPQTKISKKTYSIAPSGQSAVISAPAGGIEAPPGAIDVNGISITFDPNTGIPQMAPGLEVQVITWVYFNFKGTNIEVYPLLMIAFQKIKELTREFYKMIN